MTFASILQWVLTLLGSIPAVGPYLVIAMNWAVPAAGIVTALVAVWHAVILAIVALAKIPVLSSLSGLANSLTTDDTAVEGFVNTYILPVLNQLSMLPLPQLKQGVYQKLMKK